MEADQRGADASAEEDRHRGIIQHFLPRSPSRFNLSTAPELDRCHSSSQSGHPLHGGASVCCSAGGCTICKLYTARAIQLDLSVMSALVSAEGLGTEPAITRSSNISSLCTADRLHPVTIAGRPAPSSINVQLTRRTPRSEGISILCIFANAGAQSLCVLIGGFTIQLQDVTIRIAETRSGLWRSHWIDVRWRVRRCPDLAACNKARCQLSVKP